MKQQTIDYFRDRERTEREAVRNAACNEARSAHEQMADAYAQLVEIEELKAAGKVISVAEALRERDNTSYGRRRRGMPLRNDPAAFESVHADL